MSAPVDRRVADVLEDNNVERFRARRLGAQRRAAVRRGETAGETRRAPGVRSLPSGPAPSWGVDLLTIGLLFVASWLALIGLGFLVYEFLRWVGSLFTGGKV